MFVSKIGSNYLKKKKMNFHSKEILNFSQIFILSQTNKKTTKNSFQTHNSRKKVAKTDWTVKKSKYQWTGWNEIPNSITYLQNFSLLQIRSMLKFVEDWQIRLAELSVRANKFRKWKCLFCGRNSRDANFLLTYAKSKSSMAKRKRNFSFVFRRLTVGFCDA